MRGRAFVVGSWLTGVALLLGIALTVVAIGSTLRIL